jgi:protein-S-isoprenylcysteine O-methyltransferase Ste14
MAQESHVTPAGAARPAATAAVNVLKAAVNILFVVLFALLAISSYRHFVASGSVRSFGVLAVNTLFATLFMARRPAKSESTSPSLWLLAIAGTCVGLLMRPSDAPGATQIGVAVQVVGLALLVAALLSLRRSFAIVPANRGIREGGLYRIVRHPIYLAEITAFLGLVLANPSTLNAALWLCACVLQFARACAEERFLAADPAYRAYLAKVRYRLVPGIV